jgi:hypothetical protein
MLTENLLRIPFSVIGLWFLVPISHWLQGKSARTNLVTGGFWYDVTESQATSCIISRVKIAVLVPLNQVTGRIFKLTDWWLNLHTNWGREEKGCDLWGRGLPYINIIFFKRMKAVAGSGYFQWGYCWGYFFISSYSELRCRPGGELGWVP